MPDSESLMAHMTPWFYQPVEDRGTDALAFILSRSSACRGVLDSIVNEWEARPNQIAEIRTQVVEDSKSRPDMVGYDGQGKKRLVVEVKFWAPMQPNQACRYFKKLDERGRGLLLFICPESRVTQLWHEICGQLDSCRCIGKLEPVTESEDRHHARIAHSNKRVMLVSWEMLLDRLAAAAQDFGVRSDIHQLRGFVQRENAKAYVPLHPDMKAPDFIARDTHLRQMIPDAVGRGRKEGWWSTKRLTWGKTRSYYRRYFSIVGVERVWLGLGIEYQEHLYARTPIWVYMRKRFWPEAVIPKEAIVDGEYMRLPIHLKADAVYGDVLNEVVRRLKEITDKFEPTVQPQTPKGDSP